MVGAMDVFFGSGIYYFIVLKVTINQLLQYVYR